MSDQPNTLDDDSEISIDEFLRLLDAQFEQLAREMFEPITMNPASRAG